MLCKDETGGECRKPIEDEEVGDLVRAYDEESGESGWKPVLSLSRNSTLTTHHLNFESDELIVCTPEHPFYILNARKGTPIVNFEGREESAFDGQWVQAKYLKVGDKVLLSDGKTAILTNTELEHLSEPITTYSFEVQDFHTYYVGEQGILVHNDCSLTVNYNGEDVPVYRGVKKNGTAWNVRGRDVIIENGFVQPNSGLSINVDPSRVLGSPSRVMNMPKGLQIIGSAGGHYEIAPAYACPWVSIKHY